MIMQLKVEGKAGLPFLEVDPCNNVVSVGIALDNENMHKILRTIASVMVELKAIPVKVEGSIFEKENGIRFTLVSDDHKYKFRKDLVEWS